MIRRILIFTVLAVAAAAATVLPLWKSDAAQQRTSLGANRVLPNFDARLVGRGEFDDRDLSSPPPIPRRGRKECTDLGRGTSTSPTTRSRHGVVSDRDLTQRYDRRAGSWLARCAGSGRTEVGGARLERATSCL